MPPFGALALTASDVEAESGLIAIRSLKKRGRLVVRQVPASPAFLALLIEVHGLQEVHDQAADRRLWPWQRTRAWQLVEDVMAAARVYRLPASPKGLRHAYGVHAVLSGVPLPLVQKWLARRHLDDGDLHQRARPRGARDRREDVVVDSSNH